MANYKKLTDVEVMEEVSESTMALVEENGTLKKVPCGKGFGGGGEITSLLITSKNNGYFPNISYQQFYQIINEGILTGGTYFDSYNNRILYLHSFSLDNNYMILRFKNHDGAHADLSWHSNGSLDMVPD